MKRGHTSRFVARYGDIYECSPWVAECTAEYVDGSQNLDAVARAMAACVDKAPVERQLELIRAHPDLADRVAIAGELTPESAAEQADAGLDRCSTEEFARFAALNRRYREKFGFPFVMAVRGSNREKTLNALEQRLQNSRGVEFQTALAEIHKIARLRLQSLSVGE